MLKDILDSDAGRELREFLFSKITEMNSLDAIEEYATSASQTLEFKAQKRAVKKLKQILSEIMAIQEENVNSTKDSRDNFHAI